MNGRMQLALHIALLIGSSILLEWTKIILFDIAWGAQSVRKRLSIHRAQPFRERVTLRYLRAHVHRDQQAFERYVRFYRAVLALILPLHAAAVALSWLDRGAALWMMGMWFALQTAAGLCLRTKLDGNRVSVYRRHSNSQK